MTSQISQSPAEIHASWLQAFAALTAPSPDKEQVACPSCAHFTLQFQYVADPSSRVGFCTLWCDNCHRGHVLTRVRVPPEIPFLPLNSSRETLQAAIPCFKEALST